MNKKQFLKFPEFPGGKQAFQTYITENLMYPEEAVKHKIEGIVYLSAHIDDNGNILTTSVEKGLGYGCDEEAIRLIQEVHFGGVTNRGIRLKSKKKFRIRFSLDELNKRNQPQKNEKIETSVEIKYTYKKEKDFQEKLISENQKEKPESSKASYSYTITLK
jgi:TonB family protein